ncbi:toxin-antitoxin system YwqK family antitoxin [Providencia burhodogranariea]|nr:toxin-antitoxin system YwqK family antitoxin [Providencia burhodogranariea]
MNKICLAIIMLLSGCADLSSTVTNTMDGLGMTPDYAKGMTAADLKRESMKVSVPEIAVSEGTPEGALVKNDDNGHLLFKTVVKNKCFDEYMDVYYPNGQLRAHTPLVKCKAEGLSQSYTQAGKLKTEIFYKNGLADGEIKVFDDNGNVVKKMQYKNGYPE